MAWKILTPIRTFLSSDSQNILTPGLHGPALPQDVPLIEIQEMMI